MEEEEDRLSQLTDPILLQILSLIDINQAVQTTILSKRWKNLCFSLSDLHFHFSRFAAAVNPNNRRPTAAFSHFVSRFLSRRDASATIRTFHLSFDGRGAEAEADAAFVEECARHAVSHSVRFLSLRTPCRRPLTLPAASKTLRELKLSHSDQGVYLPERLSLPNLKTLHLERSLFVNDDRYKTSSAEPFSGFPELENLTLRRCVTLYRLVIAAPKLRFLEIVVERMNSEAMKEISAPLLTSFRYEGSLPLECSMINLPKLEEVYLNIYKKKAPRAYKHFEISLAKRALNENRMPLKCVRLLQQLGNAKTVTLTLDTIKVLEMDRDLILRSPSPFPYMRSLKLRKGRREIQTVLERVMKYLTEGSLCSDDLTTVEFPEGVSVVGTNSDDLFDEDKDELQLDQLLFD